MSEEFEAESRETPIQAMRDGPQAANWGDLADLCRTMAERAGSDADREFLEQVAFNLEEGLKAIQSLPMLARQQRQIGNIEAYKSIIDLLRERADKYEKGVLPACRNAAAFRQTAMSMEQLVNAAIPGGPVRPSKLEKPGFIL